MSDSDSLPFPVECPNCGFETVKPLSWLKSNSEIVCAECQTIIKFSKDHFEDTDDALDDIFDGFG